ncbi:MAG: bifunctional malic enzyme oxidoreductase/phosphotransacetylase [Anaerolineaceae bacterium]|nr:NADP-dependent malic enzyme [Anaerolineae bacterium]MBL1171406.1 NADP-dependent malic enzyme [Chloroflexota bacterium]MBV6465729.1 NADP-dependent malic enzyme [Anaerolineales bacterium]MCE7906628.1 NADP-dependent malic enzyme [Anaerolineae bacterium CFX3]MDL1924727.1 NADP-dependent malic enzyme [Anaerolineae bacterium AMX1]GJQ38304.1 MAG: bifunctional malic enzyme oxidoreductase/phosphotransacetylase [Anaerolineaceae bacterium]
MAKITREDALEYHRLKGKPGKIAILPTKPMDTQRDLSLAYSPGVADAVLEVEKNPQDAYEYTSKGNLVAVVSNGTAILGLGDRGALASKPVMEGKGVLFKKFADVDVFDIEVNSHDPDEIIKVVAAISPTFGGINLEDIKAPECFYIEEELKKMLDIPVFHDDQHGTAIISSAGLAGALEIIGKKHADIRLVISGAGASAISCAELAIRWGVKRENIMLVDTKGVVYKGRKEGMNKYKERLAVDDKGHRTLADAVKDADVFYGLSVANILTPEMVKSMAKDPIIFAMANPDPEIRPELAQEARPDVIIATGRSDYPNQVNNVLGFPFIFRGALDVRARSINDEMKFAASQALAALTKEDVPDSVLRAYGVNSLKFGREYIIPKPLDPRVLLWEAPAVAETAMKTGVARKPIDINEYRQQLTFRQGRGEQMRYFFQNKARASGGTKRVVFAEGEEPKVIRAAYRLKEEGIAAPILIGRPEVVQERVAELGLHCCPEVVDPFNFTRIDEYARAYHNLRARKGVSLAIARNRIRQANIFGPMMVKMGDADAFVSGLTYEYPDVIRPALRIHHTAAGAARAAGVYIMIVDDRVYLFTDATVNIDPSAEDLSEIACLAADFAKQLEIEPRVAFLSFSNFGSTPHPLSEKVRKAVDLTKARRPDLVVDGEMQADTAVIPEIVEERYPFSQVRDANVLVFPSLESANIAYKLLARLGNAKAIGPILLGTGAPVHVLQTGDDVNAIVQIASVAVMDAMGRNGKEKKAPAKK